MAAIPISPEKAESVVADWRCTKLSIRDLAEKYSISRGKVGGLCKGVPRDGQGIVDVGIQYRQALAGQGGRMVDAIEREVDEKTKDLIFFRSASLIIAQKAVDKVQTEDCTMKDLRDAQEVIGKGKENIYDKAPTTAVNVSNTTQTQINSVTWRVRGSE